MRPRIGITTSFEEDEQRLAHVTAVARAGGLPLIVPMLTEEEAGADLVDLLDGLVVTGGPAVTRGLIGDVPADLSACDPVREQADTLLIEAFLAAGKPVLGICYGMQLVNALRGGTLYADVERQQPGTCVHASQRGGTFHPLRCEPDTWVARLIGGVAKVNTRHVQAIAEPGVGLRVSATAPDGVAEAIESADGRFIGVQFHPERMGDDALPLFQHLISMAGAFSAVPA